MADLAGVNGTRKDFKVVGRPNLPGVLSWSQATGVAKFGIDYVVPDMLHAKFLRSPYANARIKKIDTTKAKAIPGVVDILTWEDEDLKKFGRDAEPVKCVCCWCHNLTCFSFLLSADKIRGRP